MRVLKLKQVMAVMLAVFMLMLNIVCINAESPISENNRFNVVVVLDSSGSMEDTDNDELRFEAVSQFVGLLAEQGNMLGSVTFANVISGQQDLTAINNQDQKEQIVNSITAIPPKGYTNIGLALSTATDMLVNNGDKELPSVIVFLSDGNTDMATNEEETVSLQQKADAIQKAREQGIQVYSVCLNADDTADITEMQQISSATGGVFQEVKKAEDLQDVFNVFYSMIYNTSTVTLVDKIVPDDGKVETKFDVPSFGVEEVNIVIYGEIVSNQLIKPDGTQSSATTYSSKTFTMIKASDVEAGEWTLVTQGVPKSQIKINMVYNTNLSVVIDTDNEVTAFNPKDKFKVSAVIKSGSTVATNEQDYDGYKATLMLYDAYGEPVGEDSMQLKTDHFEVLEPMAEGVYFYSVKVEGNSLVKESEVRGPITVTTAELTEEEKNNTAPVPVKEKVEDKVYIVPFMDAKYTLDLNGLAKDKQDDKLTYTIESSSFMEDEYTVSDKGVLEVSDFSLRTGAFTIKAIDKGGLSATIEVVVKSYNVGIMALIGFGAIAVVVLAILGTLLYIALHKPFYGDITVESFVDSNVQGSTRTPRRGRHKLSLFGAEIIDPKFKYVESYFQATGKKYIYLVTKTPVVCNGVESKKITIHSGGKTRVYANKEDYSKCLEITFTSKLKR